MISIFCLLYSFVFSKESPGINCKKKCSKAEFQFVQDDLQKLKESRLNRETQLNSQCQKLQHDFKRLTFLASQFEFDGPEWIIHSSTLLSCIYGSRPSRSEPEPLYVKCMRTEFLLKSTRNSYEKPSKP